MLKKKKKNKIFFRRCNFTSPFLFFNAIILKRKRFKDKIMDLQIIEENEIVSTRRKKKIEKAKVVFLEHINLRKL